MAFSEFNLQRLADGQVGACLENTVVFDGTSGNGAVATAATLTTALTGDNNDLTFTAMATDATSNDITIAYVDPEANNASLSVEVDGTAITVNLATDSGGDITSTAAQVDAAIDGEAAAAALVTPANAGGNNGTGVVTAMAATALTGGKTGYKTLFTVTGTVLVKLFARCTTNLAGASATLKVGTALSDASLIAQTTATDIDANELWHDASPDASIEAASVLTERIVNQDIRQTIGTANITAGALTYLCLWKPLSPGATVVAAA